MCVGCIFLQLLRGPGIFSSLYFGLCETEKEHVSDQYQWGGFESENLYTPASEASCSEMHERGRAAILALLAGETGQLKAGSHLLVPSRSALNRRFALSLQVLLLFLLYFLYEQVIQLSASCTGCEVMLESSRSRLALCDDIVASEGDG